MLLSGTYSPNFNLKIFMLCVKLWSLLSLYLLKKWLLIHSKNTSNNILINLCKSNSFLFMITSQKKRVGWVMTKFVAVLLSASAIFGAQNEKANEKKKQKNLEWSYSRK